MKKLLLFIAILSLPFWANTQNVIVNPDYLWSTVEVHCLPSGNSYTTHYIRFDGDTIIENLNYKKVWRSDDEFMEEWEVYGFVREDDDHRVYFRPPGYFEGLIYDFGVEPGDTLQAVNYRLNDDTLNLVVTSIDSVELLDGYHKRITLFEYNNIKEEVWIEGLGSLYGILNSCNDSYGGACGGYELLCYQNDNDLIYRHPDFETCYFDGIISSIIETDDEVMTFYPNPADESLNISLKQNGRYILTFYTQLGEKVWEHPVDRNSKLDVSSMDPGMYFIKVKNSAGNNILIRKHVIR